MFYTVYKITNLENNKIYVGAHKTSNLEDNYMGSGKYITNAINKYGVENFSKEILHILDSEEEMYLKEKEIVNVEFLSRDDVYNLNEGGVGGWNYVNDKSKFDNKSHSTEHMTMMSQKGKENSIKTNKYLFANDKEWVKNKIEKCLRTMNDRYGKSVVGSFLGMQHTEETKRKIGEANSKHQHGEGNSQFGTIWIYNDNLKENKKIKSEDFSSWEQEGWFKGRKMKF